mgnify:CR=1 FL=1
MLLSLHQNTSRGAGYQGSLEGWAQAGIRYVELNDRLLDDFLRNESLQMAGRVLTELGLTPVSAAAALPDLWLPGPERNASLETWRKRCDQFSSLGLRRIYSPAVTTRPVTVDDFAATPDCVREVAEISAEYNLVAMIEFLRTSTHLATLTSALAKAATASEKTMVTSDVCPTVSVVSAKVMLLTDGAWVSTS